MSVIFLLLVISADPGFCNDLDERLASFRDAMSTNHLDGYIVPNSDYHASEVPMNRDKIRQWLTGFRGSNGDAALTMKDAALWTDSRYTIQAKQELGKNWTLGEKKTEIGSWLAERLIPGQTVGADPKRMSHQSWLRVQKQLGEKGIELVEAEDFTNLWRDRPSFPTVPLFIYDIKYTGQSYDAKLKRYREKLLQNNCVVGVITAMDEIAWLLNLRGGDVVYTPLFASFMIVKSNEAVLYVRSSIVTADVRTYLTSSENPVQIKEYDEFWKDWKEIGNSDVNIFVPNKANYFVYSAVQNDKRKNGTSLVVDLRAYKTIAEVNATREAHVHDSIALIRLFRTLEMEIGKENQSYNEGDVSRLATKIRREGSPDYRGPSFADIVASGANGALPHYNLEPGHEAMVNTSAVMLIDSGGQYIGGTTDITRVLHFGKPRPIEIDVYTRLLKGVARLGGATFPEGTRAVVLDTLIRQPLFEVGLEYGHGSTHGIGIYLSVHEEYNGTYYEHFIGSQEPGYYEENNFGMRLENAVLVVPAETKYKGKTNTKFMKFVPLTLVPYERKLIDPSIMDESEIEWVNNYHKEVLDKVGTRLWSLGDKETYDWLLVKTKPIIKRS